MFIVNKNFIDRYGREYTIAEKVQRTTDTGGKYNIYNLYPIKEKGRKPPTETDKKRGFKYANYLDILEEFLQNIFVKYI